MIQFQVLTKPVAKARPRFNTRTGSVFTPNKTISFERQVALVAKTYIATPLMGAISLSVNFNFKKAKSNKKAAHTMKPDIDNLLKGIMDGLNGIAFKDDCQVVQINCSKLFASEDSISISLFEL